MLLPLACVLVMAVQSVAEVPDPRPTAWVVDQAGILSDGDEAAINQVAAQLQRERGAELAVVTVDDVPGTPKEFATSLFNTWHLGRAGHDDGVLVLLVVGKRRLEIETGVGLESALAPAWLADLQADQMVPMFKRGNFAGGLLAGTVGLAARLRSLPGEADVPSEPGEYRSDGQVVTPPGPAVGTSAEPGRTSPPVAREPRGGDGDDTLGLVAGVGSLGLLVGGAFGVRAVMRRRRRCEKCQVQMLALDELADDAHLSAGQITEERIGSMDYEVLICPGCQASKTLVHRRWFSGKHPCPACHFRTASSTSRTITQATYDHGGMVEVTESCVQCGRKDIKTRSTPRRTRPSPSSSSSSSSRSSYSSSSSSRSSYSSSRSSSSSGGRSRGGGSGSSW